MGGRGLAASAFAAVAIVAWLSVRDAAAQTGAPPLASGAAGSSTFTTPPPVAPMAEDVCQYTRDPATAETIAAACSSLIDMPGQSSDQLVSAYFFRGAARYALGAFREAALDFDKASQMRPENVSLQNHRCWTRVVGGFETDVAMKACDEAMGLAMRASRLSDILDTRGLLFLRQQKFEDAWRDYNFAAFIVPDNAHYLYGRGVAAYHLGRKGEGVADITRAEVLDPGVRAAYLSYGVPYPLPTFGVAGGP
jgi:tetratricopeptide (TPR) repeat protein